MSRDRRIYSDSDTQDSRMLSRESFGSYLASRRGSLSDLVFSAPRKLSRESVLTQGTRHSRHLSLSNQNAPSLAQCLTGRSPSLTTQLNHHQSILRRESRSECHTNSLTKSNENDKHFLKKTKSLNSVLPSPEDSKRISRKLLNNRRSRWLKKIQSINTFESALKARQNRQRFQPLVRFRRAIRTVQLLLKATAGSRHGKQHDHVSWTQMADDQSTARRTYDLFGISFDPSMFKAKREKSLANEAKAILSLQPYDRTDDQIKLVLLALNQTVDSFGEFPIKLQRSLANVGWYENFETKRVIIRQGHMADNFYFILSGTAVVTMLETSKETGEQSVRTVAFLRKGNSFGELALMHGARRSATVTCKTNVELLAVSREDFVDIFMHIEKDIEPEHIQFLRSLELLKGWPIEKLPKDNPRVCLFTFFRRGVLLCKDSNTTDWVYVIKTGSCRVLKDLLQTRPNIRGLELIQYSPGQTYSKLPPISSIKSTESISCQRHTLFPSHGNITPHGHITPHAHITSHKRLPALLKRSSQQLHTSSIEHQIQINEIFDKRHKVSRRGKHLEDLSQHNDINNNNNNNREKTDRDKVFVQIQKLGARDIFGLEQSVLGMIGQTTGCSLVSDGAECILINKKFFIQHLTDEVAKQIRKTIRPIPSEASLQKKLQDKANWDAYKTMTISNYVGFKRQLHEHDVEALYF